MVKICTKKYILNIDGNIECKEVHLEHYDVQGQDAMALIAETNTRQTCDEVIETDSKNNVMFLISSYATLV